MSHPSRPSTALAGAVLLGGLSLSASALAMHDLAQGYALGAQAATPPSEPAAQGPAQATPQPGSAHADTARNTAGKRGAPKQDPAPAPAPAPAEAGKAAHDDKAMAEGKCGEGKCGGGG